MNAAALLAELDAAGIHLACEGDRLRVRGEPGVRLAPYVERLREHKPALRAALREREVPDRPDTTGTRATRTRRGCGHGARPDAGVDPRRPQPSAADHHAGRLGRRAVRGLPVSEAMRRSGAA